MASGLPEASTPVLKSVGIVAAVEMAGRATSATAVKISLRMLRFMEP